MASTFPKAIMRTKLERYLMKKINIIRKLYSEHNLISSSILDACNMPKLDYRAEYGKFTFSFLSQLPVHKALPTEDKPKQLMHPS